MPGIVRPVGARQNKLTWTSFFDMPVKRFSFYSPTVLHNRLGSGIRDRNAIDRDSKTWRYNSRSPSGFPTKSDRFAIARDLVPGFKKPFNHRITPTASLATHPAFDNLVLKKLTKGVTDILGTRV